MVISQLMGRRYTHLNGWRTNFLWCQTKQHLKDTTFYWGSRRHLSLAGLLWEHFQEVQPSQKSAASHSHSRETDGALSKDAHKCIFLYAFLEYGQRYAIKGWQRVKGSVGETVMDLKDELAKSFQERWKKVHKCDRPGCETCLIIDMESIKVHPLQWQLPSWKISWEWRKSSKKTRCRRSWAKERGCTSIGFISRIISEKNVFKNVILTR